MPAGRRSPCRVPVASRELASLACRHFWASRYRVCAPGRQGAARSHAEVAIVHCGELEFRHHLPPGKPAPMQLLLRGRRALHRGKLQVHKALPHAAAQSGDDSSFNHEQWSSTCFHSTSLPLQPATKIAARVNLGCLQQYWHCVDKLLHALHASHESLLDLFC